jgi:hypothetical protein
VSAEAEQAGIEAELRAMLAVVAAWAGCEIAELAEAASPASPTAEPMRCAASPRPMPAPGAADAGERPQQGVERHEWARAAGAGAARPLPDADVPPHAGLSREPWPAPAAGAPEPARDADPPAAGAGAGVLPRSRDGAGGPADTDGGRLRGAVFRLQAAGAAARWGEASPPAAAPAVRALLRADVERAGRPWLAPGRTTVHVREAGGVAGSTLRQEGRGPWASGSGGPGQVPGSVAALIHDEAPAPAGEEGRMDLPAAGDSFGDSDLEERLADVLERAAREAGIDLA